MAAYATNTDLVAEFPALSQGGGFTSTTTVTATQVDEWCVRASNLIDAKIGGKYSTPVDATLSPKSFSLLKDICCWMVYARVAPIVGVNTGSSKTSSSGKNLDWREQAEKALKDIQSGAMKLNDGVLATSTDGVESFTSDNQATLQPPTFTREDDKW